MYICLAFDDISFYCHDVLVLLCIFISIQLCKGKQFQRILYSRNNAMRTTFNQRQPSSNINHARLRLSSKMHLRPISVQSPESPHQVLLQAIPKKGLLPLIPPGK